jgi:hypothetical protein
MTSSQNKKNDKLKKQILTLKLNHL